MIWKLIKSTNSFYLMQLVHIRNIKFLFWSKNWWKFWVLLTFQIYCILNFFVLNCDILQGLIQYNFSCYSNFNTSYNRIQVILWELITFLVLHLLLHFYSKFLARIILSHVCNIHFIHKAEKYIFWTASFVYRFSSTIETFNV